jgi:hypothetical protein
MSSMNNTYLPLGVRCRYGRIIPSDADQIGKIPETALNGLELFHGRLDVHPSVGSRTADMQAPNFGHSGPRLAN